MSRRSVILAILLTIGCIGAFYLIRNSAFEYSEITEEIWTGRRPIDAKKANGIYVFNELLKLDKEVEYFKDFNTIPHFHDSALLVIFEEYWHFTEDELYNMEAFASEGNTILLLTHLNGLSVENENYERDTFGFEPLIEFSKVDFLDRESIKSFSTKSPYRSSTSLSLIDNETKSKLDIKDLLFANLEYGLLEDSLENGDPLGECMAENVALMQEMPLGEGRYLWHNVPHLFLNVSTESKGYLDHYNAVFEHIDANKVYFYRSNARETGLAKDSPLMYILSNTSLRWAFYSLILTALLFLIFSSKRVQKPIPVFAAKKNRSLEYIKVLRHIYNRDQSNASIMHMMTSNFYKNMERRYRLHSHDVEFWDKLTRMRPQKKDYIERLESSIKFYETQKSFRPREINQLYTLINHIEK